MAEPLPAKLPLTLYRGDTRIWLTEFTINSGPPVVPMDLSGYDFLAQIRATPDTTAVMAVMAVVAEDAAAGRLRLTLTAEEAQLLVPFRAYWDLQLIDPEGNVRTYLFGPVTVVGDVSRP